MNGTGKKEIFRDYLNVFYSFSLYGDLPLIRSDSDFIYHLMKGFSMSRHFIFCVLLLALFSGCGKKAEKGVAIIVDGYPITSNQVLEAAEMLRQSIIAAFPEKAVEGVTSDLLAGAAQQLVANHLMIEEAKSRGITADAKMVDSVYESIKGRLPDEAAFQRELIKMGETESSFRKQISDGILLESLVKKILAGVRQIDTSECRAFYEKNKDKYIGAGRVRASQIFLPVSDSTKRDEILAKIAAIREKALSGNNFEALAEKHSKGPGSDAKGDIGWFKKGDLRPDLEKPLFALKKDEVSEVITTNAGLHLLKKTDEEAEKQLPYEEVEKRIRFLLEMQERNTFIGNYIDSLTASAKITYFDTTLARPSSLGGMNTIPEVLTK
jgi:peptidyl-prolyl cis-trans isomerase SurA